MLSVAKKLSKERSDLCRELSRLYDSMLELHNNMTMEIQVLAQENNSLRKSGADVSEGGNGIRKGEQR